MPEYVGALRRPDERHIGSFPASPDRIKGSLLDDSLDRGYAACNMRTRVLALMAAALALLVSCSDDDTGQPQAARAVTERDIVYCTIDGVDLKLDVTYRSGVDHSVPMLLQIHGGGWSEGDKTGPGTYPLPSLVDRGYVVASATHRRAPEFLFPAQLEDAKCAVRYLRAHASEYGGDPGRIGVWGNSSGGHLAAMLGLTEPSDGFDDAGQYQHVSSDVQAVVDLFGPSDLTDSAVFPRGAILRAAFGTDDRSSTALIEGSPVRYARDGAPPFLLIHGDADWLVPASQSEKLHAHLRAHGIESRLVIVRNANHNLAPQGGTPEPGPEAIEGMIAAFFAEALGEP